MQPHCGHVDACTKHFTLHSPANWCDVCPLVADCYFIYLSTVTRAYVLFILHKDASELLYASWHTDLWTLYRTKDLDHFKSLVKNKGDQCGAQVRPLTDYWAMHNHMHNSEHSSFDHLKLNWEADKSGSPHYCNILSRNKEQVTVLHKALKGSLSSVLQTSALSVRTRLCT